MATNVIFRNILMPTLLPGNFTLKLVVNMIYWASTRVFCVCQTRLRRVPHDSDLSCRRGWSPAGRCSAVHVLCQLDNNDTSRFTGADDNISTPLKPHLHRQVVNTPRNIALNNCQRKVTKLESLRHMEPCCGVVIYCYVRFKKLEGLHHMEPCCEVVIYCYVRFIKTGRFT